MYGLCHILILDSEGLEGWGGLSVHLYSAGVTTCDRGMVTAGSGNTKTDMRPAVAWPGLQVNRDNSSSPSRQGPRLHHNRKYLCEVTGEKKTEMTDN